MKVFLILIAAAAVAVMAADASGQTSRRRGRSIPRCRIGSLQFRCPTGYKAVRMPAEPRFALFLAQTDDPEGFFVALASANEGDLVRDLRSALVAKLFPKETAAFEWKLAEGLDKISTRPAAVGRWDITVSKP